VIATSARPASSLGGMSMTRYAPSLALPARFMALGMFNLLVVALLAPWAMPSLLTDFYNPHLLAFVHLNTLGVVAAVIVGASYQLIPVVLQTPLASVRLGVVSFWLYLAGVLLFIPGLWWLWPPALIAGSTLLLGGLSLYIVNLARTMRRAPQRDVVAWYVAAATTGLSGGLSLGIVLAFNKALGFLGDLTLHLLAAHVVLMLAGWIAPLLMGVAYRLVGMFTLSEDALHRPAAWLGLATATAGAWGLAASFALGFAGSARLIFALALLTSQIIFTGQLMRLYRARRRRGLDVHIPFALTAATAGVVATIMTCLGLALALPAGHRLWLIIGWLAIGGLAETAIQGFFYKIATFLVWLHRYAPLAGRGRVPRLEDLYARRLAFAGWLCWTLGLLLAALAVAFDARVVSQLSGLAMSAGLACFLINVARIAGHWRPIRIGLISLGSRVRLPGTEHGGGTT
jgi:hypothetical protein